MRSKLALYYDMGELYKDLHKIHQDVMLGVHDGGLWADIEKAEARLARMRARIGKKKPVDPYSADEEAKRLKRPEHSKG